MRAAAWLLAFAAGAAGQCTWADKSGVECDGLTKTGSGDDSAAACKEACCGDNSCLLWQWVSLDDDPSWGGCWTSIGGCDKSESGKKWVGGTRSAPGPTPPGARYHCDESSGTCVEQGTGHSTLAKCKQACAPAPGPVPTPPPGPAPTLPPAPPPAPPSGSFPCASVAACAAQTWWHLPGPNPIVGAKDGKKCKGAKDNRCFNQWCAEIESGGVSKFGDTYYYYWHGAWDEPGGSYQAAISTAASPLGPWTKHRDNPLFGKDDFSASPNVILRPGGKDGDKDLYLMFYEGDAGGAEVATAPHPAGPWKTGDNRVVIDSDRFEALRKGLPGIFGKPGNADVYVGNAFVKDNEFYFYCTAPVAKNDQAPINLWTAPVKSTGFPGKFEFKGFLEMPGKSGTWDSGGFSESGVQYYNGLFHLWATGGKMGSDFRNGTARRRASPLGGLHEQFGYFVSADGMKFTEAKNNPLVTTANGMPHSDAFAEGHVFIEEPFVYLYHTQRYDNDWGYEDLSVEILSPSPSFKVAMPLVSGITVDDSYTCKYVGTGDGNGGTKCGLVKAHIPAVGQSKVLEAKVSYTIEATCSGSPSVTLTVLGGDDGESVKKPVKTFDLSGGCPLRVTTPSTDFGKRWLSFKLATDTTLKNVLVTGTVDTTGSA